MASRLIPVALVGAAAVLLTSGKKRKEASTKSSPSTVPSEVEDIDPPTIDDSEDQEYSPDEILVIDGDCNKILHFDEKKWDVEKRRRIIDFALEGNTDKEFGMEINDAMISDHAPLCFTLGVDGLGAEVESFWLKNLDDINHWLKVYELFPDKLDEHAEEYGML